MTREDVARRWREIRLPVEGLHLDSAACSRQSLTSIEAADHHSRLESEIGGYVAAEKAAHIITAGRQAVATLTGMAPRNVVFTHGSGAALDTLLRNWRGERTVACLPGEYGPNLSMFSGYGFTLTMLPADPLGRLALEEAAASLRVAPPAMVHVTAVGSHRGVAQPIAAFAEICRDVGVPLILDAAQALGHIDCAVGADVVYASSRKWLAGPRGVGVLSIGSTLSELLKKAQWGEAGEASIAAQVGFSVAVQQHLELGPTEVRRRLAVLGGATRFELSDVPGWRVIEPAREPTAITTLEPIDGIDPVWIRQRLLADHGIVTTAVGIGRAPGEMTKPVLRASPHVDTTYADIETFAAALKGYSSGFST